MLIPHWRGKGYLVMLFPILWLVSVMGLHVSEVVHPDLVTAVGFLEILGGGIFFWSYGRKLNRPLTDENKAVIRAADEKEMNKNRKIHSFMYIPVEYWGLFLFGLFVCCLWSTI